MKSDTDTAATAGTRSNPLGDDLRRVFWILNVLAALGFAGAVLYAVANSVGWIDWLAVIGGAILIGGSFALVGGVMGFVFAIPRSRQEQAVAPVQQVSTEGDGPRRRLSDYSANTNLEQISDWLTKILVGIGLIQFDAISKRFDEAASILAPLLGSAGSARPAALSLMTYFTVWGFFLAYLSTRLWLPRALSRAEREEEVQKLEVEKDAALRAVERRAYDSLYQNPPSGYTQAIDAIEAHFARYPALRSAWLALYLAAAYGQKYKDQVAKRDPMAEDTAGKAVAAVEEALRLNPGTLATLQQLYRGTDPTENDLASLQGNARLDELLASERPPP